VVSVRYLRHVPKLAKRKHVAVRPAIVEVRVLLSAWVSMNQSAETPVGTIRRQFGWPYHEAAYMEITPWRNRNTSAQLPSTLTEPDRSQHLHSSIAHS
jgi:hypothetical protein